MLATKPELIADAFPRLEDDTPICAWCGSRRRRDYALCIDCWRAVPRVLKDELKRLVGRPESMAKWIFATRPTT